MKDTLKQLLTDCLSASKKGGSGGGVDPSKFPSQVCYQCSYMIVDCQTYFYKTPRVKVFLILVPLPFTSLALLFSFCTFCFVKSSLKLQCLL